MSLDCLIYCILYNKIDAQRDAIKILFHIVFSFFYLFRCTTSDQMGQLNIFWDCSLALSDICKERVNHFYFAIGFYVRPL